MRVIIYPNDHRPAHVHVIGNGYAAVFNLHCPKGLQELGLNYGLSHMTRIGEVLAVELSVPCKTCRQVQEITNETFEAANRRGQAMKACFPAAVAVRYDDHLARVVVSLSSGLDLAFSPEDAQGLENATPDDLAGAKISHDGFGIHFPCIDANLYIPGLLQGFLGSKRWMAELGKRGGAASSDAKATAARQNGKLGGRPRKSKGPAAT